MNLVEPDPITLKWLEESKAKSADLWLQLWHIFCKTILKLFLTQTCCNGLLKRGSMFILSENVSTRVDVDLIFINTLRHMFRLEHSFSDSFTQLCFEGHCHVLCIHNSVCISSNLPVFSYTADSTLETIPALIFLTSARVIVFVIYPHTFAH